MGTSSLGPGFDPQQSADGRRSLAGGHNNSLPAASPETVVNLAPAHNLRVGGGMLPGSVSLELPVSTPSADTNSTSAPGPSYKVTAIGFRISLP